VTTLALMLKTVWIELCRSACPGAGSVYAQETCLTLAPIAEVYGSGEIRAAR